MRRKGGKGLREVSKFDEGNGAQSYCAGEFILRLSPIFYPETVSEMLHLPDSEEAEEAL